jgi:hypothetical protein
VPGDPREEQLSADGWIKLNGRWVPPSEFAAFLRRRATGLQGFDIADALQLNKLVQNGRKKGNGGQR